MKAAHKLTALTIGVFSALIAALPGRAADRITFTYPPFGDFSVSIQDLEAFAKDGTITPNFAFYAKRATPQQMQQLRGLLQQRLPFSPVYVSQLSYAPLGEQLLERMGTLLQTQSRDNGFYALRSALILAAADRSKGLTALNVIRRFPGEQIRFNLAESQALISNLSELLERKNEIVADLEQLSATEAAKSPTDVGQQADLRSQGSVQWQTENFELNDTRRNRQISGTLYLPNLPTGQTAPLIVISHGVAEDRTTFAYLARHLASHGFAIAALEHTVGDAKQLRNYLAGLASPPPATELLDRPRDISFLLNALQQNKSLQTKVNVQQVGVIGHSLGGYTAFAIAGATIDFEQVRRNCNPNRSLNLSVLLQCRANELQANHDRLYDSRINAVFAMNPLSSTILGQRGISQIQVPVMLLGGSDDIVTPVVPEQILPFTWVKTPDKYLAVIDKGTHFSTQAGSRDEPVLPVPPALIGPNPEIAQGYTKALSLAFFQTHLASRPEFRSYLTAAYVTSIRQAPLNLSFVQASATTQVIELLRQRAQTLEAYDR